MDFFFFFFEKLSTYIIYGNLKIQNPLFKKKKNNRKITKKYKKGPP